MLLPREAINQQSHNVFAATPAEVLVRCASTARRIRNEFADFLLSGHFAQWRCRTHGFFGAQHGADLHWRCADVVRVSNRNLCRRNRKIWCAARQNREKLAAIPCVVHANFSKILRKFDRWMRAFAALHAPATRRRNLLYANSDYLKRAR